MTAAGRFAAASRSACTRPGSNPGSITTAWSLPSAEISQQFVSNGLSEKTSRYIEGASYRPAVAGRSTVPQDLQVHSLRLRGRVEAELFREELPTSFVRLDGRGAVTGRGVGSHQQPVSPLTERIELDGLRGVPDCESRFPVGGRDLR